MKYAYLLLLMLPLLIAEGVFLRMKRVRVIKKTLEGHNYIDVQSQEKGVVIDKTGAHDLGEVQTDDVYEEDNGEVKHVGTITQVRVPEEIANGLPGTETPQIEGGEVKNEETDSSIEAPKEETESKSGFVEPKSIKKPSNSTPEVKVRAAEPSSVSPTESETNSRKTETKHKVKIHHANGWMVVAGVCFGILVSAYLVTRDSKKSTYQKVQENYL